MTLPLKRISSAVRNDGCDFVCRPAQGDPNLDLHAGMQQLTGHTAAHDSRS